MKAKHAGFTLIELMVAVLLAAILLGIGAPSFADFLRNARLTSASNGLLAALHLARTEAIKRRAPVTVCASSDPTDDSPTCDDEGDFSGWIVFVDDDGDPGAVSGEEGNGTFEPGSGEELIRTSGRPANGVTVIPSTVYLQFGDSGFQRRADGAAPTDVDVRFCDKRGSAAIGDSGSAARLLQVSRTGRPLVSRNTTAIQALGGCPSDD